MKTDLDLALSCESIYNNNSQWTARYDIVDDVVGVRETADGDVVICFRGSDDAVDWFRDFEALALKTAYGHVHSGFYEGMEAVHEQLWPHIVGLPYVPNVYVTGHSLGAARAWIFGAMLIKAGFKPTAIVPLAPPRPGFNDFCSILNQSGVPLRGYHNAGDPVPDVPLFLPPLEPYEQPVSLIPINWAPATEDLSPLRCHHISLYLQGIKQHLGVA